MSETPTARTYIGYRLLPAALGLLDVENHPRLARYVEVFSDDRADSEYGATIDWSALAELNLSSTVRLRVDMARSLLEGDAVSLQGIASFGSGTYGLMMQALARCWPDPPPGIDELVREHGGRDIETTEWLKQFATAPPDRDWIDPDTGRPGCPSCGGYGYHEDGTDEGERCEVCEGRGVARAAAADRWLRKQGA